VTHMHYGTVPVDLRCVGGPYDGQQQKMLLGHVLIIAHDDVAGSRGVMMPPDRIKLAKMLGTYAGHYVQQDGALHFVRDET
jgi:hypothetical protein